MTNAQSPTFTTSMRSLWATLSTRYPMLPRLASMVVVVGFAVSTGMMTTYIDRFIQAPESFNPDWRFKVTLVTASLVALVLGFASAGWVRDRLNVFRKMNKVELTKAEAIVSLVSSLAISEAAIDGDKWSITWGQNGDQSYRGAPLSDELLNQLRSSNAEDIRHIVKANFFPALRPLLRSIETLKHVEFIQSRSTEPNTAAPNSGAINLLKDIVTSHPKAEGIKVSTSNEVDYNNVEAVYSATCAALERFESQGISPDRIHVLATPGTTIAAIGAAMATMSRDCRIEIYRQSAAEDVNDSLQELYDIAIDRNR